MRQPNAAALLAAFLVFPAPVLHSRGAGIAPPFAPFVGNADEVADDLVGDLDQSERLVRVAAVPGVAVGWAKGRGARRVFVRSRTFG